MARKGKSSDETIGLLREKGGEAFGDLFVTHGATGACSVRYGPEFVARNVRQWPGKVVEDIVCRYIEPGPPLEKGYCESFNSKLRDESIGIPLFVGNRPSFRFRSLCLERSCVGMARSREAAQLLLPVAQQAIVTRRISSTKRRS